MAKNEILFSFSKEGTCPLSLFSLNASTFKFEVLDIETGIGPVNWLLAITISSIFGSVIPISDGRSPWIWLVAT